MILLNCQHLLQLIVSDTRPGECNIIESKDKGWRHLSRDLGTLQHWFCVSLTIFRPFWLLIVLKALSMMKKSEPPGTGNQVWGWNILFGALAELIMLSVFTRAYEPLDTKQPQSIKDPLPYYTVGYQVHFLVCIPLLLTKMLMVCRTKQLDFASICPHTQCQLWNFTWICGRPVQTFRMCHAQV